jgi:hypothetical protein
MALRLHVKQAAVAYSCSVTDSTIALERCDSKDCKAYKQRALTAAANLVAGKLWRANTHTYQLGDAGFCSTCLSCWLAGCNSSSHCRMCRMCQLDHDVLQLACRAVEAVEAAKPVCFSSCLSLHCSWLPAPANQHSALQVKRATHQEAAAAKHYSTVELLTCSTCKLRKCSLLLHAKQV